MSKNVWKSLLVAPAALGLAAAFSASAVAQEMTVLEEVNLYSNEGSNSAGQVTSVSQLSDVQPTDWAFQALQSLVERYGCIAGYPDGTFRGNRAMTRYEFAAGLNACLDRILEIGSPEGTDLSAINRLQEEFAAELATLRGRVDSLEARTAELEANQFSTTTKLRGETIFALAGVSQDEVFEDEQIFLGYRVRLNFDTSFTGEDRLRARLQARDVAAFDGDPLGFSFGTGSSNNIVLDDLFYTFPLGERVEVIIGANSLAVDDFVASTISPLDSSGGGGVGDFSGPRQYDLYDNGDVGAGAILQLTDNLSFDFGYTAGEGNSPAEGSGVFNGDYSAIGQLTYLSDGLDAALFYIHSYADANDDLFSNGQVGNTYAGQVNVKFTGFQIGGGVGYTDTQVIGSGGDFDDWTWNATLAFPDLGGEGNLLGIYGGAISTEFDLYTAELFYKYQLTDNISLTPAIIWYSLDDSDLFDVDDTFIGALRTTFTF